MRANRLKPPKLSVVKPAATPAEPAVTPPTRPLNAVGMRLWTDVMVAYAIDDVGGRQILLLACEALDRAEQLAAEISRDGAIVQTRAGPREHPGLKVELSSRAFVVRSLARLGLDVEPIRPMGRPPGPF